jgi:hypothetical protein
MVGVSRQRSNFTADQGAAHVIQRTVTEHIRSLRAKDGFSGGQEVGIAPSFNRSKARESTPFDRRSNE